MSNPPVHPLLAAVRACGQAIDEAAGVDPLYADPATRQTLLVELTRLAAQVSAMRAGVLAVSSDLAEQAAARSAGVVLAMTTRTSRREAIGDERLGVALRERWPTLGGAVAAGGVTWEQAEVLVRALDELPNDLDPELVAKAEAHLVAEAGHFDPRALRRLGRHVLQVVAPDVAEDHEAKALLAEEARARAVTRVGLRPRGDGTTDLHARLPDHVASRLRAYLESYCSPRRRSRSHGDVDGAADGDVDLLPIARRRGEAFCALLEHIPSTGLPHHGGTPTQVLVMLDLDTLRGQLSDHGVAETSTGDLVSAAQARRLACTAGIVPAVLGSRSEALDLGRTQRLFSTAQHKALKIRDRHCRADGCDIPAAWCEAHHANRPWSQGGRTDLRDGLLLCPLHHHRAHDPRYTTGRLPNGDVRFTRRT